MQKYELSRIDFEIIDDAFNALLQYRPDPVIVKLRNIFRDAHTGWLEIDRRAPSFLKLGHPSSDFAIGPLRKKEKLPWHRH